MGSSRSFGTATGRPGFEHERREMTKDWIVEARCPQCGGPVSMHETDRILTCAYCRVRLYVLAGEPPKFCLPVKPAPVGEIVMVPYWRVRAGRYQLSPSGMRATAADCTAVAADAPGLAASLGLRAQAVPLRFASAAGEGRFLPVGRASDRVFERLARLPRVERAIAAAMTGDDERESATLPPEATITTATSIVYTPVRVARSVFDAVLNRRLPGIDGDAWMRAAGAGDDRPAPVRFLATLCPTCGWPLEGPADTMVLLCVNCGQGWCAGDDRLEPAPFDVLPAAGWKPDAYLPFWRAEARIAATWADLVRFANLPRVVQPDWEHEALGFWFPAFDAQPGQFLRAAQAATCARPRLNGAAIAESPPDGFVPRTCRAVTLPASALADALLVLLASLARARHGAWDVLRAADLSIHTRRLVYVPVRFNGREQVNPELQLTVQGTRRLTADSGQQTGRPTSRRARL